MDWQTARQLIVEDIDRANDPDAVDRAIIESLRFNRKVQTHFNQGRWSVPIEVNTDTYTPIVIGHEQEPWAFHHGLGRPFFKLSKEVRPQALMERTKDFLEGRHFTEFYELDWIHQGYPTWYHWNEDEPVTLRIYPEPTDLAGATLEGRCLIDFGVPTTSYNGSGWTLKQPDGTDELPGTFTTKWLSEGSTAIIEYAKLLLYKNRFMDATAAMSAQEEYIKALTDLKSVTARKGGIRRQVRGYFR